MTVIPPLIFHIKHTAKMVLEQMAMKTEWQWESPPFELM